VPDFKERLRARLAAVDKDRQPIRAELPTVKGDATSAVIRLYDPVDSWGEFWGVSAKEFAQVLDELPDTIEEIHLHINSPGGEVFDAIAIMNALRMFDARVIAHVDGLAASAASFIACSADELIMAPNSELMIHRAWGMCVGNAADMTTMAEDLERLDRNIASVYARKSGTEIEGWLDAMERETWYTAEEAVEAGLADRVDEKPADDEAKNRFDLSIFNFAGRQQAPAPDASATPPSPSPHRGQEGGSLMDLTDLRDALGLPEETSDDDVIVAALDKLTEPPDPGPVPLPEGVVAIDAAQLEQLRSDAQAGSEARAEQLMAHRAQIVEAAITDGRIPPARRDAWVAQLEADPGAEQVLASLAKGTIPVSPKGTEGGDLDTDDALYAELFGTEVKA
jgi:ATP-dependent Clp endopeptidase proteolytic subunit ClpP